MLKLYNTLTREKEVFKSLKKGKVGLYTCGPTVYDYAHIGNLRTYIFEDVLRRVLEYNDYEVKHIMNITDVGHLTSDADEGEDKMAKALKREGKELNEQSMLEVADFYIKAFRKDMHLLNIKEPHIWCKVTDYIDEQIELIKKIIKNGYGYETLTAVYFDTHKLKGYEELAKLDMQGLAEAVNIEKQEDKKHSTDFALWIKAVGKQEHHIMNWESPWGKGFPGWHLECSAMSIAHLGEEFDIHCGGVDHISVHHTNERAQNISALGKPAVRMWMHGEFLILKDKRIGKSEGNAIRVQDLVDKGFSPFAYRYLTLGAHYRSKLSFSTEALEGAQNSLDKLYNRVREMKTIRGCSGNCESCFAHAPEGVENPLTGDYKKRFLEKINNDMAMPEALAIVWEMVKDHDLSQDEKYELILDFDQVLGLGLDKVDLFKIPGEIQELVDEREGYRQSNDFKKADELRKKIEKMGFEIEDTEGGARISER